MTTREEAFEAVRLAHFDSSSNLLADRAAAAGDLALIKRINRNHKMATVHLFDAASDILDANNPGVAAAHAAAVRANAEVVERREKGEKITIIVESVATAVDAAGKLVDKLND